MYCNYILCNEVVRGIMFLISLLVSLLNGIQKNFVGIQEKMCGCVFYKEIQILLFFWEYNQFI